MDRRKVVATGQAALAQARDLGKLRAERGRETGLERGGGCGSPSSSKCSARRGSQICACRRECADAGPWACDEMGCPASVVTCEGHLSRACGALFDRIWRSGRPPRGTAGLEVRQLCPASCGECAAVGEDR